MTRSRTSIAGAIGAVSVAVAAVEGLPAWAKIACTVTTAASLALVGFWAQDNGVKTTPRVRLLAVAAAAGAIAVLTGCTMYGLRATAVIPSFGEYSLAVDGGSIGKASTNPPPTTTTTNTP